MLQSTGSRSRFVALRKPDIILIVTFNCVSTKWQFLLFIQAGAQYSATEYTRLTAEVRRVSAEDPQFEPASFCTMLFLDLIFKAT